MASLHPELQLRTPTDSPPQRRPVKQRRTHCELEQAWDCILRTWRSASASPRRPALPRRGGRGRQAAQVLAGRAGRQGLEAAQGLPLRLQPLHGGLHGAQAQRAEAAQDGGERGRREGVKLTQNAIFGRCCMNPDKFRNTNAYVDPAKFERAVGKSSVNFELQINDSEGFLAFVETLKTDRSKACMSVPAQVGARTLQLSKLMMEKAYYLHMRRLFPKMRLLFTDTDSVMVQIFELQDPLHAMNLNGPLRRGRQVQGPREGPERTLGSGEATGQLGKLGDETFPARILEYVGLRSKMYSILTVQPDGARKEKRKIKGVPKKAVTNVRHLEYREVLEEGSERRAAFAQLRSRAQIAVETVEKKSLSPFNDKVYGLDAHNSRPLGHWRNLEQLRMLGAYAPPGSAPFDLVMEFLVGPPPLGPAPALPLRLSRCWT